MVKKRRVGSRSVKYADLSRDAEGGDTTLKPSKKLLKELHKNNTSIAGTMKTWKEQDDRIFGHGSKPTISKRAARQYRRTGSMVTRGGK
jgi:hypothetical protein